jgi:hypothetical protein
MAGDTPWRCLGCGAELDVDHLDTWCHVCLDRLREKLAALLSASPWSDRWGLAYGPSLTELFHSDTHWWDRTR